MAGDHRRGRIGHGPRRYRGAVLRDGRGRGHGRSSGGHRSGSRRRRGRGEPQWAHVQRVRRALGELDERAADGLQGRAAREVLGAADDALRRRSPDHEHRQDRDGQRPQHVDRAQRRDHAQPRRVPERAARAGLPIRRRRATGRRRRHPPQHPPVGHSRLGRRQGRRVHLVQEHGSRGVPRVRHHGRFDQPRLQRDARPERRRVQRVLREAARRRGRLRGRDGGGSEQRVRIGRGEESAAGSADRRGRHRGNSADRVRRPAHGSRRLVIARRGRHHGLPLQQRRRRQREHDEGRRAARHGGLELGGAGHLLELGRSPAQHQRRRCGRCRNGHRRREQRARNGQLDHDGLRRISPHDDDLPAGDRLVLRWLPVLLEGARQRSGPVVGVAVLRRWTCRSAALHAVRDPRVGERDGCRRRERDLARDPAGFGQRARPRKPAERRTRGRRLVYDARRAGRDGLLDGHRERQFVHSHVRDHGE